MEKVKVTFEQLLAGALLKFGKVDSMDMTLLVMGISESTLVKLDDNTREYFVMVDGTIMLNQEYVNKKYGKFTPDELEIMQGDVVKSYLNNMELAEFVLRKIKLMGEGYVVKDDLVNSFSTSQISVMDKLYEGGYITDYWEEEAIYDDYLAVKVTQEGNVALFLSDYSEDVAVFLNNLRKNNYDGGLIVDFLRTQDLNQHFSEILTITNFLSFCNIYDRAPKNGSHTRSRVPAKK